MKTVLNILVAFLIGVSYVLAAGEEKMPLTASTALSKMEQDIAKAKNTAVVILKKTLQEETKKGNLKTANMIQEKIDELSESPSSSLVGIWTGNGYSYELKENGDVVSSDNNKGKWTIDKSKLLLTFSNCTDSYRLPPKKGVVKGTSSRGADLMMTKVQ